MTDKIEPTTIRIERRWDDPSNGLHARKIWQRLFDVVYLPLCDLTQMDSFLCDLRLLEQHLDTCYKEATWVSTLWWDYHRGASCTGLSSDRPYEDEVVRIDMDLEARITSLTHYPRGYTPPEAKEERNSL